MGAVMVPRLWSDGANVNSYTSGLMKAADGSFNVQPFMWLAYDQSIESRMQPVFHRGAMRACSEGLSNATPLVMDAISLHRGCDASPTSTVIAPR